MPDADNSRRYQRPCSRTLSLAFVSGAALTFWPSGASLAQTISAGNIRLCTLAGAPGGQATDSSGQVNDSPAPDPNTLASAFSGVGTVGSPGNGGTGVALDRRHILTAAHLLTYTDGNGKTQAFAPSQVSFKVNVGAAGGDQYITASAVSYDKIYDLHSGNDRGDIGIITLSQDLPLGVQTYSLASGPLDGTTPLTFVGYGQSGNGVAGFDPRTNPGASGNAFTTKRAVQNVPDGAAVLPMDGSGGFDITNPFPSEEVFTFDFDGPSGSTNFQGGTTLGNDVEGMIGNGDSGGPAFLRTAAGQYQVAGVISFEFQNDNTIPLGQFGSGGGGQSVYAYRDYINGVLAPEPGSCTALGVGGVLLLGGLWRARRRA